MKDKDIKNNDGWASYNGKRLKAICPECQMIHEVGFTEMNGRRIYSITCTMDPPFYTVFFKFEDLTLEPSSI